MYRLYTHTCVPTCTFVHDSWRSFAVKLLFVLILLCLDAGQSNQERSCHTYWDSPSALPQDNLYVDPELYY